MKETALQQAIRQHREMEDRRRGRPRTHAGPTPGVNRACACARPFISDGACLYCGKPPEAPQVAPPGLLKRGRRE